MMRFTRRFTGVFLATALLAGCGGDGSDGSDGGDGGDGDGNGNGSSTPWTTPEGFSPEVSPTGWNGTDQGGVPSPGGRCPADKGGAPMTLPITGIEYCVKAAPACADDGAGCPLYITINTEGAFFARADDPATNGAFITVELYTETDGDGIKDKLAELPRVIAHDYPGLDRERVFAIGWSAGAGAVTRGLCHLSKKSDFSEIGTTSDIYAGWAALGGCGCSNDYLPLAGSWHGITFNRTEDQFNGGDACEAGLRDRAWANGCADPGAARWSPLPPDDPYAKNGDGSTNAERLVFPGCGAGEVVGYRGRDEGHVLSFKEHFDPKISGYDTVWNYFQDKSKRAP